jgi:hypothetical protein
MNEFKNYQENISKWIITCFGEEIANDKIERCFRFAEESMELVQSLGVTKEQMFELVNYTFSRPLGEPHQEVGGVMVTLSALCSATDLNLETCADDEYQRILTKIDKIRAKHFSKPANVLSPIPGNYEN